jgi:A-kinase anchor protein 9
MQVLSLTESPYGDREDPSVQQISESWLEERRAYLSTISSLKDLITKMQVQREAEVLNIMFVNSFILTTVIQFMS